MTNAPFPKQAATPAMCAGKASVRERTPAPWAMPLRLVRAPHVAPPPYGYERGRGKSDLSIWNSWSGRSFYFPLGTHPRKGKVDAQVNHGLDTSLMRGDRKLRPGPGWASPPGRPATATKPTE